MQDPSIGHEVMGTVRSDLGAVNHFVVAILLAVVRVKTFYEAVVEVLKYAVVSSQQDYKISRSYTERIRPLMYYPSYYLGMDPELHSMPIKSESSILLKKYLLGGTREDAGSPN